MPQLATNFVLNPGDFRNDFKRNWTCSNPLVSKNENGWNCCFWPLPRKLATQYTWNLVYTFIRQPIQNDFILEHVGPIAVHMVTKGQKWLTRNAILMVSNPYLENNSLNSLQIVCIHVLCHSTQLIQFWAALVQCQPSGRLKMIENV